MEFFSGLDVGMDETAICVVDDKGKVALETTVVTDPETIKAALKPYLGRLRRLGHDYARQRRDRRPNLRQPLHDQSYLSRNRCLWQYRQRNPDHYRQRYHRTSTQRRADRCHGFLRCGDYESEFAPRTPEEE